MKLKEGWAERAINCGLFHTKRNECKGLKNTAFVKYNKLGFCVSINCPFFKPANMGNLDFVVRRECGDKVWFERF